MAVAADIAAAFSRARGNYTAPRLDQRALPALSLRLTQEGQLGAPNAYKCVFVASGGTAGDRAFAPMCHDGAYSGRRAHPHFPVTQFAHTRSLLTPLPHLALSDANADTDTDTDARVLPTQLPSLPLQLWP
ncbi:hypothetical protein EV714DRAFT_278017 [Schizophyllum commune]